VGEETFLKSVIDPPIGWVIVDRPQTRGALTFDMWMALPRLLAEVASHSEVRVLVIRGTGGHFIAGADISEFRRFRADPALAREYDRGADQTLDALADLSVPSIAMIEGACMGGGCLIAFGCDLRIAADSSRLGVPAGRLGLAYPYKGLERMVALLGEARTLELILTGRTVAGPDAAAKGLVNQCVAADTLEDETRRLGLDIAASAPLALKYTRLAARRTSPSRLTETRIAELADACFGSSDYAEGVSAFLEKRKPRFHGR
jgi:enoyl-CoA hydratase